MSPFYKRYMVDTSKISTKTLTINNLQTKQLIYHIPTSAKKQLFKQTKTPFIISRLQPKRTKLFKNKPKLLPPSNQNKTSLPPKRATATKMHNKEHAAGPTMTAVGRYCLTTPLCTDWRAVTQDADSRTDQWHAGHWRRYTWWGGGGTSERGGGDLWTRCHGHSPSTKTTSEWLKSLTSSFLKGVVCFERGRGFWSLFWGISRGWWDLIPFGYRQ